MNAKLLTQDDFEEAEIIHTREAEDISLQQSDADDQINAIFSEIGSDKNETNYHFQVSRIVKDQADMAFLFKGTAADLPILERLRDEYEGGKFHIQIYRNKKRYKRLSVTVESPKKSAVTHIKNDMAELMRAMGEQQQNNFNMLKDTVLQMVGKPTTPQPSQVEMMTGMMTLMMSMKAFVSPPAQQANSFGPEKMIELLLKGMEMGRDSGGSETGLMDIAKELIKSPLLGQLAHAATASTGSGQASPQLAPPKMRLAHPLPPKIESKKAVTDEIPAPVNSISKEGVPMKNPVIKHYLDMLVKKAEKDSDPVLYAEFILDNVPQSMVEANIMRDDLIEYAFSIDPRVKQHEKWFIELRDHIVSVLTELDEGEDTGDSTGLPTDDLADLATENNVASAPLNSTDDPERPGGDA